MRHTTLPTPISPKNSWRAPNRSTPEPWSTSDQSGRPVGIEVIRPARDWPLNEILEKYAIDPANELRLLRPEAGETYPFTLPLDGAAIVEAVA